MGPAPKVKKAGLFHEKNLSEESRFSYAHNFVHSRTRRKKTKFPDTPARKTVFYFSQIFAPPVIVHLFHGAVRAAER